MRHQVAQTVHADIYEERSGKITSLCFLITRDVSLNEIREWVIDLYRESRILAATDKREPRSVYFGKIVFDNGLMPSLTREDMRLGERRRRQ